VLTWTVTSLQDSQDTEIHHLIIGETVIFISAVLTWIVTSLQDSDDTPPNYNRNCYLHVNTADVKITLSPIIRWCISVSWLSCRLGQDTEIHHLIIGESVIFTFAVLTWTVTSLQDSQNTQWDTPLNYRRNCYLYIRCVKITLSPIIRWCISVSWLSCRLVTVHVNTANVKITFSPNLFIGETVIFIYAMLTWTVTSLQDSQDTEIHHLIIGQTVIFTSAVC
jgi:hypothetical protein